MSRIPEELRYSPTHQWARREADGTVTVGITDHAQAELGDIVYVELPKAGAQVKAGQPCMVIESVKAASDVHAPVSGEIVAVNEAVAEHPERLNEDPYSAWLFRVRPSDPAEWDRLLDAEAYRRLLGEG
ncbi:glycine cleavage system H protein [Methylomarinovum caldicuralii]|uniref:Glycine cleavage system H protein n=1 Tax=Methylomarinovum caldicuralii TaxID=438856 RepID=A0AAU9CBQ8_9GAMM|nr:glycine cleavage system protein GcvH [Methylomarinovum caldicuralii]BCX81964.1 glycine cleavage system H protein [Methylomarinovum caldicuralii]